MTLDPDAPVWMIGCGTMGGAMLRRWIAAGLPAERFTAITRGEASLPLGVRHLHALPPGEAPGTVLLAVKPQQLDAIVPLLRGLAPPLLLSILAGVEEATLAARFPAGAIVRAMPNLPVAIGRGVVALHWSGGDPAIRGAVEALMAPLGHAEWIGQEPLFDAVTALAGCGPAFVFRFADALAGAGAALGLPSDQAMRLALATLDGAAAMAHAADASPAVLADRVASPGGSTREGLNVLDREDALTALMRETLAASARRNAELAAAAR